MTRPLLSCIVLPLLAGALSAAAPAPRPRQYKRIHQRIMRLIERGKAPDALAQCKRFLKEHPDEVETLYCLAVAQTQLGDVAKAAATAARAVEKGLPIGRFLAGPRDILKPLVGHPAFQELLKQHPGAALVHGPMLGCVTDTSARFWVRTAKEATVKVVVAKLINYRVAYTVGLPQQVARTSADADYTAVVEVKGLRPSTTYGYNLFVDGKPIFVPPWPMFDTYPLPGRPFQFRVAFGGGAGYVPWNERTWDLIWLWYRPLALLLLGDNVYIDDPKSALINRFTYYRRQSRPEFRRLVARTPVYAIWDDHDFGTNDCVPGPLIAEPTWKKPVWKIFAQNWNNPAYGGGEQRPGCWFAFSIADVDFFLTDSRFYRTSPRGKDPTMLGPVQKAWLLEQLAASKATFKVLINGVPWAIGTKPGSRDTWDGFPAEREEIFSFLEKNKIGGVFLLSADRHRSDVWKIQRPNGYTLYEFESSRLTNQHVHRGIQKPNCLFSYNAKQSFGLLDFDTTAADPTVTYRIVTIDGEEIHAFTLKKSQLTHK